MHATPPQHPFLSNMDGTPFRYLVILDFLGMTWDNAADTAVSPKYVTQHEDSSTDSFTRVA